MVFHSLKLCRSALAAAPSASLVSKAARSSTCRLASSYSLVTADFDDSYNRLSLSSPDHNTLFSPLSILNSAIWIFWARCNSAERFMTVTTSVLITDEPQIATQPASTVRSRRAPKPAYSLLLIVQRSASMLLLLLSIRFPRSRPGALHELNSIAAWSGESRQKRGARNTWSYQRLSARRAHCGRRRALGECRVHTYTAVQHRDVRILFVFFSKTRSSPPQ